MRVKVLPEPVVELIKRNPRVYTAARRVRMGFGRTIAPRTFPRVPGRVHFNDFMLSDDSPERVDEYRRGGEEVVELLEAGLAQAGRRIDDVQSWLDFGCGYGRVVRMLVQRVDPRLVFVADLEREGVDFCASEFGVNPVYSSKRLADVRLPEVDVAYAISVVTHLPETGAQQLLSLLASSVRKGGLMLFTTHGRWCVENIEWFGPDYARRRDEIAARFERDGTAFVAYPHYLDDDYGIAWHSRSYVTDVMATVADDFELLLFEPAAVDARQDVYVYRRLS